MFINLSYVLNQFTIRGFVRFRTAHLSWRLPFFTSALGGLYCGKTMRTPQVPPTGTSLDLLCAGVVFFLGTRLFTLKVQYSGMHILWCSCGFQTFYFFTTTQVCQYWYYYHFLCCPFLQFSSLFEQLMSVNVKLEIKECMRFSFQGCTFNLTSF